jgi:hypothetical protein
VEDVAQEHLGHASRKHARHERPFVPEPERKRKGDAELGQLRDEGEPEELVELHPLLELDDPDVAQRPDQWSSGKCEKHGEEPRLVVEASRR